MSGFIVPDQGSQQVDRALINFEEPTYPQQPVSEWRIWPGLTAHDQIPANAKQQRSDIWLFPAPKSSGSMPIIIYGSNVRLWRYFLKSKNGFGSPGRPEGPWGDCLPPGGMGDNCDIGWCSYSNGPAWHASGPGAITCNITFSNWSGDYPRYAEWAVFYSDS